MPILRLSVMGTPLYFLYRLGGKPLGRICATARGLLKYRIGLYYDYRSLGRSVEPFLDYRSLGRSVEPFVTAGLLGAL